MPYKNKSQQLECQRRWYSRNKEKRKKQIYKRKKEIKEWIKKYKENIKCSNCPENHPICIDFHHEEKKELEIANMVRLGYSIKKIRKEISKCIPLCSNCHRKVHYKGP